MNCISMVSNQSWSLEDPGSAERGVDPRARDAARGTSGGLKLGAGEYRVRGRRSARAGGAANCLGTAIFRASRPVHLFSARKTAPALFSYRLKLAALQPLLYLRKFVNWPGYPFPTRRFHVWTQSKASASLASVKPVGASAASPSPCAVMTATTPRRTQG